MSSIGFCFVITAILCFCQTKWIKSLQKKNEIFFFKCKHVVSWFALRLAFFSFFLAFFFFLFVCTHTFNLNFVIYSTPFFFLFQNSSSEVGESPLFFLKIYLRLVFCQFTNFVILKIYMFLRNKRKIPSLVSKRVGLSVLIRPFCSRTLRKINLHSMEPSVLMAMVNFFHGTTDCHARRIKQLEGKVCACEDLK